MEEPFKDIIEKDEKIIKTFKPNKTRFWLGRILSATIIPLTVMIFSFILPYAIAVSEEANPDPLTIPAVIVITLLVILAILVIVFITGILDYRNRFYAYTNKRIIIRSGIIGIDYRSLEYQSLTATNVRVTFVDKLLGTTGTLEFGSPSSPVGMVAQNGSRFASPYSFMYIAKPYDTLRELKEYMDHHKTTQKH